MAVAVVKGARMAINELDHFAVHRIPKSLGISWQFAAVPILPQQIEIHSKIRKEFEVGLAGRGR
jgi:hypothetical protein